MLDTIIFFHAFLHVNTGVLTCEIGKVTFKENTVEVKSMNLLPKRCHEILLYEPKKNHSFYFQDSAALHLNPNEIQYANKLDLYYLYYQPITNCTLEE
jgi:hypothetical protein